MPTLETIKVKTRDLFKPPRRLSPVEQAIQRGELARGQAEAELTDGPTYTAFLPDGHGNMRPASAEDAARNFERSAERASDPVAAANFRAHARAAREVAERRRAARALEAF
jgi:hypothetical protein